MIKFFEYDKSKIN